MSTLLDTLSHPIRREVIYYFERTAAPESQSLSELGRYLDDRMPPETAQRLRIELHHAQLPTLEERGWLAYDCDTGEVCYHGHDSAKRLLGELQTIF